MVKGIVTKIIAQAEDTIENTPAKYMDDAIAIIITISYIYGKYVGIELIPDEFMGLALGWVFRKTVAK